MLLSSHVVYTGAQGRLVGMTTDDLHCILDSAFECDRVVVHFHGGLVSREAGERIAGSLLSVYQQAGAYPIFIRHSGEVFDVDADVG
jgi:hypothetical protein